MLKNYDEVRKGGVLMENTNRLLYVVKNPSIHNVLFEEALSSLNEQLDMEINVLHEVATNTEGASLIFAPHTWDMNDAKFNDIIIQTYASHGAIILIEPTGIEINAICGILKEEGIHLKSSSDSGLQIFAIQSDDLNTCYKLRSNASNTVENITESLVRWIKLENRPNPHQVMQLQRYANKELIKDMQNVDLLQTAKSYVDTLSKDYYGKHMETSFYITSCHLFDNTNKTQGTDWYFIFQYSILNGQANYSKYWGGTRVKVNNESWYVGQGEVALHYVDYYEMENYFIEGSNIKPYGIQTMLVYPTAINNMTTYSEDASFSLSGLIGFDSKDGGSINGNVSMGGTFSSGISFNVQDCTCTAQAGSKNNSSVKWNYKFKRAEKKSAAHPQTLLPPADLSHSTFTPENVWIWKIPTEKRASCPCFRTELTVGEISTISRYSGSQSAKDVGGRSETNKTGEENGTNIYLPQPPLFGCDIKSLTFAKNCESKIIKVVSQGDWEIIVPEKDKWCHVLPNKGKNEKEVKITVDAIENLDYRETTLTLIRGKEEIEIEVTQMNSEIKNIQ